MSVQCDRCGSMAEPPVRVVTMAYVLPDGAVLDAKTYPVCVHCSGELNDHFRRSIASGRLTPEMLKAIGYTDGRAE